MDYSNGYEGPAILQFKKWDPSQVRLDLSQFREAFISPTRESLLLLSYQCEAMLLPLNTGESVNYSDPGSPYREDPCPEASPSVDPTTSGSVLMSSDDDHLHGKNYLYPNNYPFICDVRSSAWGVCMDAYSDHDDLPFKEFLFLCGNHGVTVHAFCSPLKSTDKIKTVDGVELERGVWVQWGPSISSPRDTKTQENDTTQTNEASFHSERWLKTFLTDVETLDHDGIVLTRFPVSSSYPSSASTVSFSIFRNSPMSDFVNGASSSNNNIESLNKMNFGSMVDAFGNLNSNGIAESMPVVLSNFLSIGENILCNCSRVFSSNHHNLIGFVLCLWEDGCDSSSVEGKTVVSVATLGVLGLHWVSSVKLEDSLDEGLVVNWRDFQFSDNLLACLSASGLILFFEATTGECVARLNILKICGLNTLSNSCERKQNEQKCLLNKNFIVGTRDFCSKIMFKRLIVASHTSFLAVVDEHGAVYIMCAGDYVPDKFYSYEKLFPHYQHLGLGLLIGWKVGGSEISQQRVFSNIAVSHSKSCSPLMNFSSCCNPDIKGQNLPGSYSESLSKPMRKVFLPMGRPSEDDIICFSPLGITRLVRKYDIKSTKRSHIVHSNLHVGSTVHDDRCLYSACEVYRFLGMEEASVGVAVGCAFQGCFYLVTNTGLSVVLPSVSVSSGFMNRHESFQYQSHRINMGCGQHVGSLFTSKETMQPFSPWKLEVIDRVLVYDGSEEADHLCLKNGWDLKISRMRRLQLSLEYLKFDEIFKSLEMLACVNLAEEGILRLLFVAVYLIFHIVGTDSEISAASRLLAVGTQFSIKLIRKYGLLQKRMDAECNFQSQNFLGKDKSESENSRKLKDSARYLEIIRNIQHQLSEKINGRGNGFENDGENGEDANLLLCDSLHSDLPAEATPVITPSFQELNLAPSSVDVNTSQKLALVPMESLEPECHEDSKIYDNLSLIDSQGELFRRNALPFENPKDTVARWEINNLDVKTIVKDALFSGRLPLAVLQLHLRHIKNLIADKDPLDTFTEVCDVGKAFAYDLFLEGETELAMTTLRRLGEDVETCLKQLTFGTLRSSLRIQISEQLRRYGYLGSQESMALERISLIERFYPCRSFWRAYNGRQKEVMRISSIDSGGEHILSLLLLHLMTKNVIECGEIDGVVMGSLLNCSDNSSFPLVDEDTSHDGYWVAAAIWFDMWDQIVIDRIVLDQSSVLASDISWESQFEYHVFHNDWEEVSKLLDIIPLYLLFSGNLQICLGGSGYSSDEKSNWLSTEKSKNLCPPDELDGVYMYVRDVRFFVFSAISMCSTWLRMLIEQKLAKKFIFIRECWSGTEEIVALLSNSGFITSRFKISSQEDHPMNSPDPSPTNSSRTQPHILHDFHRLIVHFCTVNNLPNFLDLYLDHHSLVLDNDSLASLQESVGNCQWAKWLLLSRIPGREYDASFANVRSIMSSNNAATSSNHGILEIDDLIQTVDDIAESGGELAALATLMFSPFPIQDCLSTGVVNRDRSFSAQCKLESLKPTLRRFPTLRRMLVASCLGQDPSSTFLGPTVKNFLGNSLLSDYLNWRANIFFSAGFDTSLSEMLPSHFSRTVRRLVRLYVQGPDEAIVVAKSPEAFMNKQKEFICNYNDVEKGALSWELSIQKCIEEELCTSSLKDTEPGVETQLHRGRALAAFNHLLGARIEKFKLETTREVQSDSSVHRHPNVQQDIQTLLAPLTESETSLLSCVKSLAIINFEDSLVVTSCIFLLELCGLSASVLRVDVAALSRIFCFYKSSESQQIQHSPKGSAFYPVSHDSDLTHSLAHALADYYRHHACARSTKEKGAFNSSGDEQPAQALVLILQHLERASLPLIADERTCGTWLFDGNGDGAQLRSIQKNSSQQWNLVTLFCKIHHLPLSTKYLAMLARDNDWVGFLSEAQAGGYHLDTVIRVVARDFGDQRLKSHLLIVLRGMQLKKMPSSSSSSDTAENRNENEISDENARFPVELFRILAECEQKEMPGNTLLIRARKLGWSILAMLASCFPDVSHLSCLTVWLEITAAREISSIKVNGIVSVVSANVRAAVQATNSLPVDTGAPNIHYNRRKSKRQRLLKSFLLNPSDSTASDISSPSNNTDILFPQVIITDKKIQRNSCERIQVSPDSDEEFASLSEMVAVLCEQHMFLPLLRAFEMFLPSCSLLPFIRALQAFSQMRLSEASAHLDSFSAMIKEESLHTHVGRENLIGISWIGSTAKRAADAVLSMCPSPYEKRCLLKLLSATDFCDEGFASTNYQRLLWKINIAEPSLRKDDALHLGSESLDDVTLLATLEENGHWEHARNWAKQMETSEGSCKFAVHHVTETQAESMVAEWKEFLWDVPEERVALWGHCQILFCRHSFPPLRAGLFFLKHAEAVEKDLPARELHELLLLSLQWLSGLATLSNCVYPLHLLREIETRVWLLAVESETQIKSVGSDTSMSFIREPVSVNDCNIIDRTASIIAKMDNHLNLMRNISIKKDDDTENLETQTKNVQVLDAGFSSSCGANTKTKRRAKGYALSRRPLKGAVDQSSDVEDKNELATLVENSSIEISFSRWEERIKPLDLEKAVLSLLEFGQITAAKQLQRKLSSAKNFSEIVLVDVALKLANVSTLNSRVPISELDSEVRSVMQSYNMFPDIHLIDPLQVLEALAAIVTEGSGRGLLKRIIAILKAAIVLHISFSETFAKPPIEVLQLLSLKAQDSFDEANLLVQCYSMPASSIARILAESFLKGLLAAHRGGYMDFQKEEGPSPLLWRFSDFLKWVELCPSEAEVGHALMCLVITGQQIPHACEVELLILSHHFYRSSVCLDGVDVLVALAATRVDAYVSEGDFVSLARLVTGVGNFHALNFILGILIENGQLDLLLHKFSSVADTNTSAEAVRGFQMAVLTSLRRYNPNDFDAFALVYDHFDMKHEAAALLEARAVQCSESWISRNDKEANSKLLESMRYYIEAAEVHSSIDAGNKARNACAQASLLSLQIRIPDTRYLNLSDTNARRTLVDLSRFQEALIMAEAYGLNCPGEWALVLWNRMLKPDLMGTFMREFVSVLRLRRSTVVDVARFYRAEVTARGDLSQFAVWLSGGGLPADWARNLERSFRCLLRECRDLRLRLELARVATGFEDVVGACLKAFDMVPETAGPLVLRKGHGGAYRPLM